MSLFNHFDGMCFPQPGEELYQVNWRLRHGKQTQEDLMVAASVISAYSGLVLNKTQKERNYVCSKLRRVAPETKEKA